MGFFAGRVTCMRFKVSGRGPRLFGPEQLEQLEGHAIGRHKSAAADGTQVGWIAADHILDTRFDLAKNIVNDTLHFALRVDQQKMPADLLRAYTQVELEGLAAGNPSGQPSPRQKREARMLAKERLEHEAKDGRFLRRKAVPLLWDAQSSELLVGSTARSLVLECPRGQTGRESITSEGPAKLPEALRAIQAGKLPRKAGLTLVRHDHQYELTLQAETLAVGGARLPAPQATEDRAGLEERVTQLRHLLETLDLVYN